MADTLETLYNGTLQSSDFNSSGEATVFTNNSSQRRVIKYVQSLEGNATYPASGKLMVGDHELGTLSGNLEGTAIIGTGESLKVKATNLPTNDRDIAISWWGSGNTYHSYVIPYRNGIPQYTLGSLLSSQNNGSSAFDGRNLSSDCTWLYTNVGGTASTQGNLIKIYSNLNNSQGIYIGNSAGSPSNIYYNTTSYKPWVFDQKKYVYSISTTHLERLDATVASPSLTNLKALPQTMTSLSSHPKMFFVGDDYLIFNGGQQNNDSGPYTYQISTDTLTDWGSNNNASAMLSNGSSGRNTLGNALSDGSYVIYQPYNATSIYYSRLWTPPHTGVLNMTSLNIALPSAFQIYTSKNSYAAYGDRFYYMGGVGHYLQYYDWVTGESGNVNGTNAMNHYSSNPTHLGITEFTPQTSTQSGRTYEGTPSIKLRITGIKSE